MTGYNREDAAALVLSRVLMEEYASLDREDLPGLVGRCIEADFDYMLASDILRPDGSDGENYYNKNNAFAHIAGAILCSFPATEAQYDDLCRLVEDYMDFHRSYLELNGLCYPGEGR